MNNPSDYPMLVFVLSFLVLWLSERLGASFLRRRWKPEEDMQEDFSVILAATLTLLALIIGFSFSMAVSRYDQGKNYKEEEANAIGTEYVRAELLPAPDAAKVRALLANYLDQRVLFYSTRDVQEIRQMNARTAQLQTELWSASLAPVAAQPTPPVALVVSGMNDVLNSQGYTQAAFTAENHRDCLAEESNSTWPVCEVVKDLTHEVFLISSRPCRAYTRGCTGWPPASLPATSEPHIRPRSG